MVTNSTVSGNTVGNYGGGIAAVFSALAMTAAPSSTTPRTVAVAESGASILIPSTPRR